MTRPTYKLDASDPLVLDRLVDGELTDAQERDVIAQLNTLPDGWRRCALAFLEARCWQRAAHIRELSAVPAQRGATADNAGRTTEMVTSARPAKHAANLSGWHWQQILALSALFLVAFTIGSLLPRPWLGGGAPSAASGNNPANTRQGTLVDNTQQVLPRAPGDPQNMMAQHEVPNSNDLLLGNVRLVDNAGQPLDVPVYDWNEDVAEQLMYPAQTLPSEFYQQLKRHEVRSHQRFVPVRLQDGRQVVVPVQKVEIVPVGGVAY